VTVLCEDAELRFKFFLCLLHNVTFLLSIVFDFLLFFFTVGHIETRVSILVEIFLLEQYFAAEGTAVVVEYLGFGLLDDAEVTKDVTTWQLYWNMSAFMC
jgi:hypothetical protein